MNANAEGRGAYGPSTTRTYRQRLVVYVVWHPEFAAGAELARRFYDHLTRDSQQPIARGLGIPVYFRSAPVAAGSQAPRPILLDEAHHTAAIVLVDDAMVLNRDAGGRTTSGSCTRGSGPTPTGLASSRSHSQPMPLACTPMSPGRISSELHSA